MFYFEAILKAVGESRGGIDLQGESDGVQQLMEKPPGNVIRLQGENQTERTRSAAIVTGPNFGRSARAGRAFRPSPVIGVRSIEATLSRQGTIGTIRAEGWSWSW